MMHKGQLGKVKTRDVRSQVKFISEIGRAMEQKLPLRLKHLLSNHFKKQFSMCKNCKLTSKLFSTEILNGIAGFQASDFQ